MMGKGGRQLAMLTVIWEKKGEVIPLFWQTNEVGKGGWRARNGKRGAR